MMSVLSIVSVVWFASEIILGRLAKAALEKRQDNSSLKVIWTTIILSISVGILLSMKNIGSFYYYPIMIHTIGIIFIVCGLLLRWIAILTLRKFFTVQVTIKEDHKLVKTGIFKFIRHPSYLGSLLSFLGLGIALVNWLSIVIIFVPVLFAFLNRISVEEKVLIESFGDEYIHYIKETKILLPGLY